jgi:hypothetical protein
MGLKLVFLTKITYKKIKNKKGTKEIIIFIKIYELKSILW